MADRICPECGRKMKQQFIGLKHCKCGMSWLKSIGYFQRTSDMVFCLERVKSVVRLSKCRQSSIKARLNFTEEQQ